METLACKSIRNILTLPVCIEGSSLFIMFIMSHFFCHSGALKCSDKVIDSLFHTKCLDTHINEKIIILNWHCLVSSDLLEVYKDKASFLSK